MNAFIGYSCLDLSDAGNRRFRDEILDDMEMVEHVVNGVDNVVSVPVVMTSIQNNGDSESRTS